MNAESNFLFYVDGYQKINIKQYINWIQYSFCKLLVQKAAERAQE